LAVIFPRWTNRLQFYVAGGIPVLLVLGIFFVWYYFSPKYTDVGYSPTQPVPFSHQIHAGQLDLDCRYCHNTVERSNFAAVPPAQTCLQCHTQILADSPRLAQVTAIRECMDANPDDPNVCPSIEWVRVHLLPDYAYFNHSAHLAAGVGCVECHGRIDQMTVVHQVEPLSMGWCLGCHRDPIPSLRPPEVAVTAMTDEWPRQTEALSRVAASDGSRRHVAPPVHCSGCHR
jgi:hypothetical protein